MLPIRLDPGPHGSGLISKQFDSDYYRYMDSPGFGARVAVKVKNLPPHRVPCARLFSEEFLERHRLAYLCSVAEKNRRKDSVVSSRAWSVALSSPRAQCCPVGNPPV